MWKHFFYPLSLNQGSFFQCNLTSCGVWALVKSRVFCKSVPRISKRVPRFKSPYIQFNVKAAGPPIGQQSGIRKLWRRVLAGNSSRSLFSLTARLPRLKTFQRMEWYSITLYIYVKSVLTFNCNLDRTFEIKSSWKGVGIEYVMVSNAKAVRRLDIRSYRGLHWWWDPVVSTLETRLRPVHVDCFIRRFDIDVFGEDCRTTAVSYSCKVLRCEVF